MLPEVTVLGLDVGGSSVKSGLVRNGRMVSSVLHTPVTSQADRATVLGQFKSIINLYDEVEGVAFAFPGPFDYQNGVCLLQGLEKYGELYGVNLTHALGLRIPAGYVNDAEAAIVGEARFGAGRGRSRVVGITLGTGLGSAFLVDGKPVVAGAGVPEAGWLYNQRVGPGIADELFSIRGVMQRAEAAGLAISRPEEIISKEIWASFGSDLGRFLHPYLRSFGADCLLVLGGISGAFELFGPALNDVLGGLAEPGVMGGSAPILGAVALFEERAT